MQLLMNYKVQPTAALTIKSLMENRNKDVHEGNKRFA